MTNKQAEKMISEKLIEIYKIMKEFDSENYYLSLCVNTVEDDIADTHLHFNNDYWERPEFDKKIDKSIWMKGGEIVAYACE